jgi:hypothetical protein
VVLEPESHVVFVIHGNVDREPTVRQF